MPDRFLSEFVSRSGDCWRRRFVAVTLSLTICGIIASPAAAEVEDDYNLALQFYKQSRWELAAGKLQQFLNEAPADHAKLPLAKLYLGQALVHQRNFKDARPVFRDFVDQYPRQEDVPLAMYRVAECSYFLDDFSAAQTELTAFLRKVPGDNPLAEWALLYLGETELQLQHHDKARQAFETGLMQFAEGRLAEELRFGLARAWDGLNRPDEARKLYEQIASAAGRRAADAQFNLAAQHFEKHEYQQAAAQFTAIGEKFPAHNLVPLATLNAGFSYYHLGDFPRALQLFETLRDDQQVGATAQYWIGLSLKSQEKFDEASRVLLEQLTKDDSQPLAELLLFHAADSRLGAKDYAEARRLFQEVHRRWPTGDMADDSLHLATEASLLAGDAGAARRFHQQFQTEFPQSGLKLPQELLWGRLLLAEGDELHGTEGTEAATRKYREAADLFTRVLKQSTLEETQMHARLQLARAWDRLANYEQLLQTLAPLVDAAQQASPPETVRMALAMQSTALLALKRYDEAIAAARSYLDRNPNGPEATDAWANISLASAHKQDWSAVESALAPLHESGNQTLANRIGFEVAEIAYDASQWATAEGQYQHVIEQGAEGEFYRPAISGLAYSLYEQGRTLNQQAEEAAARGESDTAKLASAIGKFDDAALWFARLAELSGQQGDRVVQSDALYMKGLSLRLARRLPAAIEIFMDVAAQFGLPANVANPQEADIKAGYNAYRSAKEAARVSQELKALDDAQRQRQIDAADRAYQIAYEQLQRQPAEQHDALDDLLNEWALVHYNAGGFERANELFARLVDDHPQSPWADDARMLLAEHEYFAGHYEAARTSFRALAAEETTDDFVHERSLVMLMDIAAQLEDWEDVAATANDLVERFPNGSNRWEAEYRRGEAALQQEDLEAAQRIFSGLAERQNTPSIAAEEWYPGVWLMLAETYLRLKQYEQVRQTADEFTRLHPDSPLQYHLDDVQGRALQKQARFDEARAAFRKVIDSPHGKGTETAAKDQFFVAESYLIGKEYEKAFEEYYRVLRYAFPDWQSAALYQAGQCEEKLQRWQGAAKSYRQLLEDFPGSEYADDASQRLDDLKRRFPDTVGS